MATIHSGKKGFQADTQTFQPGAEKLEAIFEGSKKSPSFTISSRDKGVFTRDTRTRA
jgi:hypothetical protein